MAKMSEKEKIAWDALYEYFKKEIMKYDDSMKLNRFTVQRLKSMAYGEYMHHKNDDRKRVYSFRIILYTFKYKKKDIDRYIMRTEFENERHKINGVLKIVESSINDAIKSLVDKKKRRKETKSVDVMIKKDNEKASYKSSKKRKTRVKEDLW
jgi:hypothetical protein